jgi:hypothetical protein
MIDGRLCCHLATITPGSRPSRDCPKRRILMLRAALTLLESSARTNPLVQQAPDQLPRVVATPLLPVPREAIRRDVAEHHALAGTGEHEALFRRPTREVQI